jgi:hypothetical protein
MALIGTEELARPSSLRDGWRAFFFEGTDARRYAALRVLFGLFALRTMVEHLPAATNLLSAYGWAPMTWRHFKSGWSLFYLFSSPSSAAALLLIGALVSMAMIVGFRSRLSTCLVFIVITSVTTKHHVGYGYYGIVQVMLFYLALCRRATPGPWMRSSPHEAARLRPGAA